ARSPLLEIERLQERSVVIDIAGRAVQTLSCEDHLLLLAVHAAKHLWRPLRVLADIAALIDQPMDWNCVLERAEDARADRLLFAGLELSHELLAAQVPADVLARAREDALVQQAAAEIRGALFQTEGVARLRTAARLLRTTSPRERLARAMQSAVAPTRADWLWLPLPDAAYPLYYALRPLRLLLARGF